MLQHDSSTPVTAAPEAATDSYGSLTELPALPSEPIGVNDWMTDGLCLQSDPDLFFPERGGSSKQAKRICADCPVAANCLAWALSNGERHGVWGGTSEGDRRRMHRRSAA